jgi:hypothetical protein
MEKLKPKEIKILNQKIKIAEKQLAKGKFIEHKDFIFDVDLILKNRNKRV